MSETKTQFKWFSITEYEKEADYLTSMQKSGWKFTKVTFPGRYHFERCTPEEMVYQLDYNQEGLEHKAEYVQMFADCGWEYIQDYVGYSYFRKSVAEMEGKEEIFCDDESRLDMMKRIFRGRMIPLLIIFFGIIIPQIAMQANNYHDHGNELSKSLVGFYVIMLVVYLLFFLQFGIHYYMFRKKVKH
ncbi:MAG: DUF2812 domain-containing protein [Lachnospiraceae bacterium]